jgi:hypothetical protein
MKHCTSPYVMCCDQDDVWELDKIQRTMDLMKQLEQESSASCPLLVFTDLKVANADMTIRSPSFLRFSRLSGTRTAMNYLLIQNVVTGCTMMFNDCLRCLALEYHNHEAILMHDWWMALVACAFGKIGFLDVATINYRQHGHNSVGAKNIKSMRYLWNKIFVHNDMRDSIQKTVLQAQEFYKVYEGKLNDQDKILVKTYSEIYNYMKVFRLVWMIKYGFYKNGISRKIGQIIFG